MKYKELCDLYEELEQTSSSLEKTTQIAEFLKKIKSSPDIIYLIQGRISPDYNKNELGISTQLVIKAIQKAAGIKKEQVIKSFKQTGDLGTTAENLLEKKQQSSLFTQKLTAEKVIQNLQKLPTLEGKGTIDNKISLILELLNSTPRQAKYIIRTILSDLKIGVGSGILRDAIVKYCFPDKDKKEYQDKVQQAYDKLPDFSLVFEKACKNKLNEITLSPGNPIKVMLFPKAKDVEDAFRIVGKPAAFEYKYDGFRLMINKDKSGKVKLFTRRLDNVTNQFPDVVKAVEHIKADTFVIDSEVVGYDSKTKKYKPFQYISQRIKRKYDIDKLVENLPVELMVFDIIYYNGKSLIQEPFEKRRKLLEKITKEKPMTIRLADQIITDNEKEVEKFYKKALDEGQEGLMGKNLQANYKPGSRIGHAVKLKPEDNDFDLVITGAEYGTGKRAGWLTSFDVSCKDENEELLEIGKVSTGLKEKQEQGLSFEELTKKLKPLINEEHGKHIQVKPEIIVTVQYQNIQTSPTYSSGYALRFPRIKQLRPDRGVDDIATLNEIKKEAEK